MANSQHSNTPAKPDEPAGTLDVVKDTAAKTAEQARHAFEQSRDTARQAARRTAKELESNPLGILVGGVAIGVLAGALVPRSQREKELLAPVGKRIAESGTAAIAAAKERGFAELESRGLTSDGIRDQAKSLFEGLSKAASGAGNAAADAARANKG